MNFMINPGASKKSSGGFRVMLQLNPTIPVETPKGRGETLGWIDYSQEHDLLWVVALDDSGEVWIIPNDEIRLCKNFSIKRRY